MESPVVSTVLSRSSDGLDAPLVRVEVHLGAGLPAFHIVGLPEVVVRESKERVRSALLNSGFEFPAGRITVNLAPADVPKIGGRFDLPIAVGILAASQRVPGVMSAQVELYGELSLSGELRSTPKLLPALVLGTRAQRSLIIPKANSGDAAAAGGMNIMLATSLGDVCAYLNGQVALSQACAHSAAADAREEAAKNFSDVKGQTAAKRALEIAAAGAHAALMVGPPGTGKTMLAERLPSILPPLEAAEALEVACIASLAGTPPPLRASPPFRQPQHTASLASLIGGGAQLKPGEIALAHRGVLFLDELPEFSRDALEALREPMESGRIVLSRAKRSAAFPAEFLLVAAMNPCACGFLGDSRRACRCTPEHVRRYRSKLSGPMADRIDLHIELAPIPFDDLSSDQHVGESSHVIAARVAAARAIQLKRQGRLNSRLTGLQMNEMCALDRASKALLAHAMARLGISARGYDRIRRIARTCADLAGCERIGTAQLAEAINWRSLDRATAQ